jgi:elongation factor Ts
MEIKAADVSKLRQMSGAGLMECKKALVETNGDMDAAMRLLREQGIVKSAKRADRTTSEGRVEAWVSDNNKEGLLIALKCETDFVARNEEFVKLSKTILESFRKNPSWTKAEQFSVDTVKEFSAKSGEKIEFNDVARLTTQNGVVASYVHHNSKLGVLVQIDSNKECSSNQNVKDLAKTLALQVAGGNPQYVSRNDVPKDIIEREKDIAKKQMEGQKKPPEILEKIATGKLEQFFKEQCLVDQVSIQDPSGQTKIQDLVNGVAKKEGLELNIARFARFLVGAS